MAVVPVWMMGTMPAEGALPAGARDTCFCREGRAAAVAWSMSSGTMLPCTDR